MKSVILSRVVLASAAFQCALAATADQWRGRSIYQIITDRYALPQGAATNACDPAARTWCGGTWNTITANLDYIQDAGFTAIWISPVNQNYEGPTSAYGDAYHGYWIADVSQLNSHFGTSDDLKALSAEVHRRNMFLMVDIVANNVMSTSTDPGYSSYFFKDASLYHPYCPIDWSNTTSEQVCWLGDTVVPLPDLDTKNPTVISQYGDWIANLVQEYSIDGLRIDAAKHVNIEFWPPFCAKAGVFCMGEVFDSSVPNVAMYQGPQGLDSVLNYPIYNALVSAFTIPGPLNVSNLVQVFQDSQAQYKDVTLLGNFLENQDVPRWHNISVDPQSMYNAMTFTFMSDGIPIVYYGQEQSFSGNADPLNREPLWPSDYAKTNSYNLMTTLNTFRNFLVNTTSWATQQAQILTTSTYGIAIMKGPVISIMTNIGSPPQNGTHIAVTSPYPQNTAMVNILTCAQWVVGSEGTLVTQYTLGGVPTILIPLQLLNGSGLCNTELGVIAGNGGKAGALNASASTSQFPLYPSVALLMTTLGALLTYL
ncbi:glycoside hydrolase family 13 protein [Hypholoma sublateritium FD-334 SS-4]|uniref:alpha-amylase n=1 Tax=Hypholoma sublateritium (strain FD-334 SS-4) TaxID=945553 RepID=A0A0D2PFH4_HYPSF|nr:glycoside hydrolase family 13 protein [Hypholoma sublateritium FD-334 SS-4]